MSIYLCNQKGCVLPEDFPAPPEADSPSEQDFVDSGTLCPSCGHPLFVSEPPPELAERVEKARESQKRRR